MRAISLIILLSLLLSSCSHLNYERSPAADSVEQTKEEVLEVFEFRQSKLSNPGKDYRKIILNHVKETELFKGVYGSGNEVTVEFVEDASIPNGIAYFPEFTVKDNAYKIVVLHSKEAYKDPVASSELLNFFKMFSEKKYFLSHFSAFEMYYNAIERDPLTAQNWSKIRELAAKSPPQVAEFGSLDVVEALKTRGDEWTKEKEDYDSAAEEFLKQQRKLDKERRAVIESLDKATEDLQFKNLIAKNDRKGVASLLKKYLPWEQMAPFEKRYWETYLETIQNPLPMDKRILIYRGVQDDFIYSAYQGGKELEKETAKKEGKVFVMSSIMTKNQGTWNRRLRSLTAMNEKFIATNFETSDEFTKSARIITMFVNHSQNPQGSPFLSFTPKFEVARNFGATKMSAYALDPRLVSFNFASKFKNEVEFLLPLMTFPEDIVAFYDAKVHPDMANTEDQMKLLFKQKLFKSYGEEKGESIYKTVLRNSKEYFDSALNRYEGKVTSAAPKEPNLMVKFFNKIFTKKLETPKIEIAPAKSSACIDIISSFWK
ncbi:MAG: hypothetical protein WC635_16640 [Bacteriovorax sp.]|jgi:hypothetical protein